MIDHISLLLLMGAAATGLVAHLLLRHAGRALVAIVAAMWFGLCFVPAVLMQGGRWPDPLSLGTATDYAAAAPLHVGLLGLAGALATTGILNRVRVADDPAAPWRPTLLNGLVVSIVAATVWAAWLLALEGEISEYTVGMIVNCVVMAGTGSAGAAVIGLLRRSRRVGWTLIVGAVAGLAAATGAAATLPHAGAIAVGVAVGGVAAVACGRRDREDDPGFALVLSAGLGGGGGLLALGLLDERAGFFYSGQPTLALAQVTLVAVTLTLGYAVGVIAVVVTGRRHARTER